MYKLNTNFILLICLLLSISIYSQNKAEKIDSVLKQLYAEKKINGSFLVAEKGKVIYSKSFGLTEDETGILLNDHSVYELASVSKQFTAVAIMMLKEKGKLNYDDAITKFLPELSAYANVSIRHLLNHTGGISDAFLFDAEITDANKIIRNADLISVYSKHRPKLLFEPGTKWEYSNMGYLLLASIVEKASGMSYYKYLQDKIFRRLGMKNTFVNSEPHVPGPIQNYAHGYVYSKPLKKYVAIESDSMARKMIWSNAICGPSKIWSTTSDLYKWDRALYGSKLISQHEWKQVFVNVSQNKTELNQYAFGWYVEHFPALGNIMNHGGSLPGYKTFIDRHIDSNKTIIMLQNREDVTIPLQQIRAILASKPLHDTKKSVVISDSLMGEYEGVYMANGAFRNIIKKGTDYCFFADGVYCKIYFMNDRCFFNTEFPSEKEMTLDKNGKVSGYRLMYFGSEQQRGLKIQNPDTLNAAENFFNEAGWNFLENKNYAQATKYLKRGLTLYPGSAILSCNLAHCYLFANEYEKAIDIYKQNLNKLVTPQMTLAEMVKQDFDYFINSGFDAVLIGKAYKELNLR